LTENLTLSAPFSDGIFPNDNLLFFFGILPPAMLFTYFGRKTVSLTVGNNQGVSTKVYENNIAVSSSSSEIYGSLIQEGFDSQDEFNGNWIPFNYDLNESVWHQVSNAGYSNNTCTMLNAMTWILPL
jgi:hypothetical protein